MAAFLDVYHPRLRKKIEDIKALSNKPPLDLTSLSCSVVFLGSCQHFRCADLIAVESRVK